MGATRIAVHGDFVSDGAGQLLDTCGDGNGVDKRLPSCRMMPSVLVPIDVHVHAAERGFGYGLVHMFAGVGTLLAAASQSVIVRRRGLKLSSR